MDIADRLHGYAMLHKGMTPESWAMAEARDEIIGLRRIAAAQRDLITALEQVADISIHALAEQATNVFDVAEIERKLKTLAAAKVGCMMPNYRVAPSPRLGGGAMSSIQSAKIAMGYQTANQRPACCRCAHVEERGTHYPPVWHCNYGGFLTNANAICSRFALNIDLESPK
jgi:hypothetical protein